MAKNQNGRINFHKALSCGTTQNIVLSVNDAQSLFYCNIHVCRSIYHTQQEKSSQDLSAGVPLNEI